MKRSDIIDDFDFHDEESGEVEWREEDGHGEVAGKYFSLLEAEVAAARLRSEGIACFIANGHSQTMLPGNATYVRLHVREADLESAQEILKEMTPPQQEATPNSSVWGGCLIIAAITSILWLLARLIVAF